MHEQYFWQTLKIKLHSNLKPIFILNFQYLLTFQKPGFEFLMEAWSQDWGFRCRLAQKLITVNLVQGFSPGIVQKKGDVSDPIYVQRCLVSTTWLILTH